MPKTRRLARRQPPQMQEERFVQSKAKTVKQYLSELSADRRKAVEGVRKTILENLDKDYEEGMQYGMIGYFVPHRIYPSGYHCDPKQPVPFVCLASQKNYLSLYLMPIYGEDSSDKRFREQWAKTGKKLDMGKCCIRFKTLDDLALEVIGETIRRMPVRVYLKRYEQLLKDQATSKKPRAKSRPAGASARPKRVTKSRSRPGGRKAKV